MELMCVEGAAPGAMVATVAHAGQIRQLAVDVARHEAGGWRARLRGGAWGPRCHAVATAIMLEMSEAFEPAAPRV